MPVTAAPETAQGRAWDKGDSPAVLVCSHNCSLTAMFQVNAL